VGNPAEENVPSPGLNSTGISLRGLIIPHHRTNAHFHVSETPTGDAGSLNRNQVLLLRIAFHFDVLVLEDSDSAVNLHADWPFH